MDQLIIGIIVLLVIVGVIVVGYAAWRYSFRFAGYIPATNPNHPGLMGMY